MGSIMSSDGVETVETDRGHPSQSEHDATAADSPATDASAGGGAGSGGDVGSGVDGGGVIGGVLSSPSRDRDEIRASQEVLSKGLCLPWW